MIAICAMILPGISGAFLLLILGKYAFVTGALKNPLVSNNFFTIMVFCMGCFLGLISFSKFIKWALQKHHSVMMAILTGFMIGSLKKVWPVLYCSRFFYYRIYNCSIVREI
jgi:putative membrane protein